MNFRKILRKYSKLQKRKLLSIFIILAIFISSFSVIYTFDNSTPQKGKATFQLSYRFYLRNEGPLNLSSLNVRLALLKDWTPVQNVSKIEIETIPDEIVTDEYNNEFAWYRYNNFNVGNFIDLKFHANLSINLLDYTSSKIHVFPYDRYSTFYQFYTKYHPLTDTTDPVIQRVAQNLVTSNNLIENLFSFYNFTSLYLTYKLLGTPKGASYAIRNGFGDCDEYSSLFIALARSYGVPSIEYSAWLGDFYSGYSSTDDGAVAHAYPMFYIEGTGWIPVDPTRGNKKLFDNWMKSDYKRITLTRGPDHPYRYISYKWIPIEGYSDPLIVSNYTIAIQKMTIQYYSVLRLMILISVPGIPITFLVYTIIKGIKLKKERKRKLETLLSPIKEDNDYKKFNN
ncbi:MAG: transglutaminase family protein [Candidatus Odinarchaeota archaeon]